MTATAAPLRPLTRQQERIFRFIAETFAASLRVPAIRDICEHMQISSPNGVTCHLKALEQKGWLTLSRRKPGKDRGRGAAKSCAYQIVGLADAIAPALTAHVKLMMEEAARADDTD